MPKIDRPFVPQQPGAGTDNYIDGGPTRAGLEQLRNKVNAAPTTWATVAAAEAASYTEPESVVVTETGRTYIYSASSEATRDGIRVLTPAGGGRLLMTAPVMTDEEAAAATRLATASQSGLMSDTQASKLSGIAVSADATGFLGSYTTSQITALTGMTAGNWVRDSSRAYRPVVYNGTFWLPSGHVVLQNRTGAASVAGTAVQLSASYDFAVELPNIAESDTDICGIMVSDGVANGSDVVIDALGSYFSQVLVVAGDEVASGYYMAGRSDGLFISRGSARLGSVGRALETKTSASNFLVWVLTHGTETV
jgi:hypothetical protein